MSEEILNEELETNEVKATEEEIVNEDVAEEKPEEETEKESEEKINIQKENRKYFTAVLDRITNEQFALKDRESMTVDDSVTKLTEFLRERAIVDIHKSISSVFDKIDDSDAYENINLFAVMKQYVEFCSALINLAPISYSVSGNDWEWDEITVTDDLKEITVEYKDFSKTIEVTSLEINKRDNNVYRINKDNGLVFKTDAIRLVDSEKGITALNPSISLRFISLPTVVDSIQSAVKIKDLPEGEEFTDETKVEIEEYVTLSEEDLKNNVVFTTDNPTNPVFVLPRIPFGYFEEAGIDIEEEMNKVMNQGRSVEEHEEEPVVEPEVVATGVEE